MGLLSSWSARAKGALEITERDSEPPERGGRHTEPVVDANEPSARMTWTDICRAAQFRGRWVALCECHYDESTGKATEGAVVDVDDDLVELCSRIRASDKKNCAILFCDETAESH
jgi:hypothetical protein